VRTYSRQWELNKGGKVNENKCKQRDSTSHTQKGSGGSYPHI